MSTDNKKTEKTLPIIKGIYRPTGENREIVLWMNPEKCGITAEAFSQMTEAQQDAFGRKRDMMGCINFTQNGQTVERIYISGWMSDEDDRAPRIKISGDMNSGQGLLGSIHAMTTYQGKDADAKFGLRLIGDLTVARKGQAPQKETFSGEVNFRAMSLENFKSCAFILGFPETMIDQYVEIQNQQNQANQNNTSRRRMQPA